jgi:hypothetical protein
MNELLTSLKSDLLDRRLLPVLVVLGAVLAAAIAYAVLGSGSSSPGTPVAKVAPSPSAAGPASGGSSLTVHQASGDANAAVAETTEGARYQHHSGAHNPFAPLASGKAKSASSASHGAASAAKSSSPAASGSASSGATPAEPTPAEPAPAEPTQPAKPQKPKTVYVVDILYGLTPTTPDQLSQLTPYAGLKRLEPLPSASDPKVIFAGVDDTGKSAIFTLAGEAIVKGEGVCQPSATQCEAIKLAAGKSEEFEYVEANGQNASYELKVVSIAKRQASAATAARLNRRNRAGAALLRRLAPAVLNHLRFSSARGVLVYVTHHGA